MRDFVSRDVPPYAILSHAWGSDEVVFQDMNSEIRKSKGGYKKVLLMESLARADGINYFWIDSCCTIQIHHRRQRPTKRVAYAAENGGRTCIAF